MGELRYIDITEKKMMDLLNESIAKYPRKFHFQNDQNNLGMKDDTLLDYVRRSTLIKQIKMYIFQKLPSSCV